MSDFWNTLFYSDEGKRLTVELRELRKGGRPFLALPQSGKAGAVTLDLYPAQSFRARAAKSLLQLFARAGLSIGLKRISLSVSPEDKFLKFLSAQVDSGGNVPQFGILAGNPAHDTQRFIFILFDSSRLPVCVIKAGLSEPAKALIDKEQRFLASVPAGTIGIPKLRATFAVERAKAFAMDFVQGRSPVPDDEPQIHNVVASWISGDNPIPLHTTACWRQLENSSLLSQQYPVLYKLRERKIQATLHHGDFVPWNIKVSEKGAWTVLDWERGDFNGIPGWDWLHYVVQKAVLVEHIPVDKIARRIEDLLESEDFKTYSKRGAIDGIERELVVAYFVYLIEIIKPAEGLAPNRRLLASLMGRWLKN